MCYVFWGVPLGSSRRLVVFDVDGTLNRTEEYAVPAYKKVLSEMGADGFKDEMLRDRIGAVFADDIRYFFGSRAEEKKEEFERLIRKYWMKEMERKARTFPHTEETLRELGAKGYSLAICSNAENEEIGLALRALKIRDYFSFIQGVTGEGTKTHSLRRLLGEIKPEWAVMVGDRFYDKEAARENGIPFIACLYGYGREGEFSETDLSITKIRQLPSMLEKIK